MALVKSGMNQKTPSKFMIIESVRENAMFVVVVLGGEEGSSDQKTDQFSPWNAYESQNQWYTNDAADVINNCVKF